MILPRLVQRALLLVWVLLGSGLAACRATPGTGRTPPVATEEPAPLEGQGQKCFVVGRVENPGPHRFHGDLTLFEAIMQATPKPDAGNLGRVRLIRADPRDPFVEVFDLSGVFLRGDSTSNVHVHEGDVIDVQSTIEEPSSSTPR